jgi:hypothetical protein
MSNKLDINFIRSEFAKEGYTLLATEYKNNRQKLYYICPRGHRHYIIWKGWKTTGHRCAVCSGRYKYSTDFIKSEFEKEGYQLLTTEYKNNKQRLNYICPNGHNHSITWRDWIQGCRCKQCCLDKRRVPLDFVRSEFEKEGCILLTTVYKNNLQKLDYICPNGHHHSINWNDWNDGHRCRACADINNSGSGNQQWRGGISFEPYCPIWKDVKYKTDIKNRDGDICLNPYCNRTDKNFVVHHVDYDKKNCAPQNLITVCNSCNSRANKDRKWHTEWYRTILSRRYAYRDY